MFPSLKLDTAKIYLFIEFAVSVFFSMMFVNMSLYEATVAGLTPVQLVLAGITLETSAFVEIPTGMVADACPSCWFNSSGVWLRLHQRRQQAIPRDGSRTKSNGYNFRAV
jgi:hypothetical protein